MADLDCTASKLLKISPVAAAVLTLNGDAGQALVEWRREASGGSVLIASRTFNSLAQVTIPVANENRVIRIKRPGYAPVSLFLPQSRILRPILLAPGVGGGELYGVIPDMPFRPEAILLDGTSRTSLKPETDFRFRLSGLVPGPYTLTPQYRGGILGAPTQVTVIAGQTAETIPMPLMDVGALAIDVDQEVLGDEPARLEIRRLVTSGRTIVNQTVFVSKVTPTQLSWSLEGLVPGRYDAEITNKSLIKASTTFIISKATHTPARLSPPKVIVSGRVMFGKDPARGVVLTFFNQNVKQWRIDTNSDGEYQIALPEAGVYNVHVSPRQFLSSMSRDATFREGSNLLNLNLGDGVIHVKLKRTDGRSIDEIVQIHLRSIFSKQDGAILSEEGPEFDLIGLLAGTYAIAADTPSGFVSRETASVTLSADRHVADVVLNLDQISGFLEVIDEAGNHVSGVSVITNGIKLKETMPGSFQLERVSPGTELGVIAPLFVPVCRMFTQADLPVITVVLVRGTATGLIRLSPPRPDATGVVRDLPGSDCPVPISRLPLDTKDEDGSTLIQVHGLPEGIFQYRPTEASQFKPWTVPGPAVTFTRPPQ